jgi:3-oxoacid CoA-transferase subunit B
MSRSRDQIAAQVASDIEASWSVNLGVGIPTLAASHLHGTGALVHSENGILGMGPPPLAGMEDPDLVDAGKRPATVVPGGCYFDSVMSFGLVRGGHLDLAVMGAYQVSCSGDLANWKRPGRRVSAIGGAADLAIGARRVWIAMEHVGRRGEPRLLETCTYPLTAVGVVGRVYTDLATLEPTGDGRFRLRELAEGVTVDDVRTATHAEIVSPAAPIGTMRQTPVQEQQ